MKKFDYEKPELNVAEFGKFVQGASVPGGNSPFGNNGNEGFGE
jgi:hypothetical protein